MADQRRESEHRPSPEALLEAARREESRVGKLRIFVGAAPGVGKTYEMLQQAHARSGTDKDSKLTDAAFFLARRFEQGFRGGPMFGFAPLIRHH